VNGQESMRCDLILQLLSPQFVKYTHPTPLQLLLIAFKKEYKRRRESLMLMSNTCLENEFD